mgnify:CR=1 FL=1
MDGEAGAVEHFYAGDWSAADFGLAREVTYCAQDYEVALKVMLACGLTKRKAYTGLNAENKHKWSRDNYAASTVDKPPVWREGQARYQGIKQRVGGLAKCCNRAFRRPAKSELVG